MFLKVYILIFFLFSILSISISKAQEIAKDTLFYYWNQYESFGREYPIGGVVMIIPKDGTVFTYALPAGYYYWKVRNNKKAHHSKEYHLYRDDGSHGYMKIIGTNKILFYYYLKVNGEYYRDNITLDVFRTNFDDPDKNRIFRKKKRK